MRFCFRKDGNQHIATIHLFFTTALHMGHSPLQNTVEGNRLGRLSLNIGLMNRKFSGEKRLQPIFQVLGGTPAFLNYIICQFIVEQSVEHMLHGHILVMIAFCLTNRPDKGCFQCFTYHNNTIQTFSMEQRRGYSLCLARS